jgi:hypothetical protein
MGALWGELWVPNCSPGFPRSSPEQRLLQQALGTAAIFQLNLLKNKIDFSAKTTKIVKNVNTITTNLELPGLV